MARSYYPASPSPWPPARTVFFVPLSRPVPAAAGRSVVIVIGGGVLLLLFGAGWVASFWAKEAAAMFGVAVFFAVPTGLLAAAVANGWALRTGRRLRVAWWLLFPATAVVLAVAGATLAALLRFRGG